MYQVGLGAALMLLVIGIAAVLVPTPEHLEDLPLGQLTDDDRGILRERLTVIVGVAAAVLLVSLYQSRALPTLSVGLILGSIVLLLTALTDSGSGGFINFYYELTLDGGAVRNQIFAAVTAVSLLLLLLYGFNEWDRPHAQDDELLDQDVSHRESL